MGQINEDFSSFKLLNRKEAIALGIIMAAGIISSIQNYLLFHTAVELFCIVVAFSFFMVSLNTYRVTYNDFFLFLGIAYGFVGIFDLLHTLAYSGMNIFAGDTTNLATQLWIIARYMEALSIFLSFRYFSRVNRLRLGTCLAVYGVVSLIFLLSVFTWEVFPLAFIPGVGLTSFKIVSEWVISLIILSSLSLVKGNKKAGGSVRTLIIGAYLATVAAEISFTLYSDPTGTANIVGHILKFISFYLIYKAMVENNIKEPNIKLQQTTEKLLQEITDRMRMEEEMVKASKLESIATLAGGIAHDFNNLLTIISGNVSLAKFYAHAEPKVADKLTEIEKAARDAAELTRQLLTFSKGGQPVKSVVSVKKLLVGTVKLALSGSNVSARFVLPEELPSLEVDEGQMKQVISNIIINADQAMPEGGIICIRAEVTSAPESFLEHLQAGKYIKLSFTDQGIGIPSENIQRIFDPFFTSKDTGHGLGLSTSFSIVKKHEGHISVQSEEGIGTTFCVYLPACCKSVEADDAAGRGVVCGCGRVLVMDDMVEIQKALGKMLLRLGYEVDCVDCGAEALRLYRYALKQNKPYDVVILDLTVPGGMGGKETMARLKKIDPDVNAVVTSGYAIDPVMPDIKHYGFCGYLRKPFVMEEVSQTISEVLHNSGPRFMEVR